MTFLQPFILWGLPLVLLPVIIHLINRMRHRPRQWAAMQFLLAATRSSTSHSKIKNWLILAMRILAVLLLLLFLSRPLVGGWLGWAMASAPDAILLLVDRSASMESRVAGTNESRREYALKLIASAAGEFENNSHLILIDSATRKPETVSVASLAELPGTQPTDTAADIPAMLQASLDWLIENDAGTAEVWIASDLQSSNWLPGDSRWEALVTAFDSLPQKVRIRLLATTQDSPPNTSISVSELARVQSGETGEVRLAVDLKRSEATADTAAITRTLNGIATEFETRVNGQSTRWRHRVEVGDQSGGWGKLELPADGNPRDNVTYYRYSDDHPPAGLVITESALGPLWQAAASVADTSSRKPAKRLAPDDFTSSDLRDMTLVVWQAPLPQGDSATALRQFVNEGGRLVFFPLGEAATTRFAGLGWGEKQEADEEPFKIGRWDEDQAAGKHGRGTAPAPQPTHRAAAATGAWPSGRARRVQRRPGTARASGAWPRGGLFLLHPAHAHMVGAGRRHGGRANAPAAARRRERPVAARLRGRVRQGRRRRPAARVDLGGNQPARRRADAGRRLPIRRPLAGRQPAGCGK